MAIELKKGARISLEKKSNGALGEMLVNLNWNKESVKKGFLSSLSGGRGKGIDLDLGCLFELKNGSKGCVQALGNAFGSLSNPPFISLDGDDRTGESAGGENLRINGDKISQFKRILIYTFIYEGAADWKQTNGIVTIKYPGSQDIIIRMDDYSSSQNMCGIALLENSGDETFSVEKLVRFFSGHRDLDRAYGWGMKWVAGSKD
ncbi:MAG: TerD family protein [Treponema sp.]|jgi:tellurite resistance protein TerA|nr:TerD family protein [Treponema sp.]